LEDRAGVNVQLSHGQPRPPRHELVLRLGRQPAAAEQLQQAIDGHQRPPVPAAADDEPTGDRLDEDPLVFALPPALSQREREVLTRHGRRADVDRRSGGGLVFGGYPRLGLGDPLYVGGQLVGGAADRGRGLLGNDDRTVGPATLGDQ